MATVILRSETRSDSQTLTSPHVVTCLCCRAGDVLKGGKLAEKSRICASSVTSSTVWLCTRSLAHSASLYYKDSSCEDSCNALSRASKSSMLFLMTKHVLKPVVTMEGDVPSFNRNLVGRIPGICQIVPGIYIHDLTWAQSCFLKKGKAWNDARRSAFSSDKNLP